MKTIIEQTETPSTQETVIHAFERAGLGKAPYKFTGYNENVLTFPDGTSKAGGCCDYCYTGIRDEYHFRSADGKSFKVGCDCLGKSGDNGLVKVVQRHPTVIAAKRAKLKAQNSRKLLKAMSEYASLIENHRNEIEALPHPHEFKDRGTGLPLSLMDYADWMITNAGLSGICATVRLLKKKLNLETSK